MLFRRPGSILRVSAPNLKKDFGPMTATSSMTATIQQVRHVASLALGKVEGLAVQFPSSQFGGFNNARLAARSFQTSFCSFRQREHRKAQRAAGELSIVRDSEVIGPFDNLSAIRRELPNNLGWEVRLVTCQALNLGITVIDLGTGEEIAQVDGEQQRWDAITHLMFRVYNERAKSGLAMSDPLGVEDVEWLRGEERRGSGEALYEGVGLRAPWLAKVEPTTLDLADLEGDMFGEGS